MSTRASRLRRWAIILGSAFAVYSIVGFFVLPPIVRAQLVSRLGALLDREVRVERVRINPLSFAIAIHGLRIIDRDGADLASWRELYINADPLTSLAKLEWHLGELRVVDPHGRLVVDEHGKANVADLIAKFSPPADGSAEPATPSGGLPRVAVKELRIERWAIDFSDLSRHTPFHTVVGPMTFALDGFTTRPDARSPYHFSGTTNTGETFAWTGNISAASLGSQGHVEFTDFQIPKHMPFLEALFPGAVKSGRVSFKGDYLVAMAGSPVARIENASVAVDDVSVSEASGSDALVKLARLRVDISRADAVQRTADISDVMVDGLEVYATRDAQGAIDLLRLLPAAPAAAAQPAAAAPPAGTDAGPAVSARVARIVLKDGRVAFVDQSNPRTARILLDQISVTATDAGTDLDREVGLEMSARWNEHGWLSASGAVRPLPSAARLHVQGGEIDLAPLDPFIEPFADVRIKSADAWFSGTVEASVGPGGKPALTWQGDAGLDGLSACEGRTMSELAGWKRLAFTGTEFHLEPLAASAREIALVEPTANVALTEDGALNLQSVLRMPAAAPAPTASEAAPAQPGADPARKTSERVATATHQKLDFDARVDAITITGGRFGFADHSFKPGFSTQLRDFTGSIRGLSSANLARADVDFAGSLDGVAPLKVSGQINPLADDVYSDLKITFSNIDLPMFSPYSARFIGQKVQKGKLRVDVGYKLSQRDLIGENNVLFDQFYLGEKVPSAEAVKLPVGLALALLRDRNGQIALDVPVRGNLDDPDFKYGRVVWRTIGNLLVKAATSPFSMLGNMFGGRDLDLSQVDFASGSAVLTEDARRKVDVLTKALFERPALRLEITAPPAPTTDRAGIVNAKFAQLLREEKQRLASPAGPAGAETPADAGAMPAADVLPEEVNALIASLFARTFPDEAASGAAAAAAAGVTPIAGMQPSEPEKSPGVLVRTWRRLFGGGEKKAPTPAAPSQPEAGPQGAPAAPALTLEAMHERLLAGIVVADEEFQALARERAVAIRDALVASGKVEAERVFLVDSTSVPEGATGSADGGRVFFSLQ